MSEPTSNSKLGKVGLTLSLVPILAFVIAFLMGLGSSHWMGDVVGPLFSLMPPFAIIASCFGLKRDHLKRFAMAGLLISLATLGWFAVSEGIKLFTRG